jgi:CO/xanthine dehydrogenase FAD-binding subunit
VAATPLRLDNVIEELLSDGKREPAIRESLQRALAEIEPMGDLHATADYRRRVAVTLGVRAIGDAYRAAMKRA